MDSSAGPTPRRAGVAMAGLMGLVALVALVAGCGLSLKEQAVDTDATADAAPVPEIDGGPGAVCSNGRVVYLHFEGLTLSRVSIGQTDATQNRVDWLAVGSANIPAYKAGAATRATEIQQITDSLRQTLGAFPITVVTQRPAAGPYHLLVFGGRSAALGNGNDAGALTGYDCANLVKNNVVWVGEKFSPQDAADYAVGGLGLGLGLAGTTDPSDCMCGWGNSCTPISSSACTLSSSITNDGGCSARTPQTQNEVAAFRREFCDPLP